MNKVFSRSILICLVVFNYSFLVTYQKDCCSISKSTWLPRSFVSYQEHDLLDSQDVYYKDFYNKGSSIHVSFFTEYMQNFGNKSVGCKNLGAMPFWSGVNSLTIGNNDGRADLDAYQMGLGNVITDANGIAGEIQLNPTIQHFGTDMLFHYIHKQNEPGFYLKVHAPVGAMKVTPNLKTIVQADPDDLLNFTQQTLNPASSEIDYLFPAYPTPARRQKSIAEAFYGGLYDKKSLLGNVVKPIVLRKARISPGSQTIIRIGDITVSSGYNFISNDSGFFGLAFKVSCPTGNVPTADYVLEPIFGRAGAWGVGCESSGVYNVWNSYDYSKNINLVFQGEVLHLFAGRRPNYRTFDLKKNGKGSKYLLVQSYINSYFFDPPSNSISVETPQPIKSASDITTLPVISEIAAEGSVAIALQGQINNWNVSIGAEFWGRTQESLSIDFLSAVDIRFQNLNDYAVLGRQLSVYEINGQGSLPAYYCEPEATISKSQNPVQLVGSIIDVDLPAALPKGIVDARISTNRIPANLNEALDIAGAQALSVYTGKIFGRIGYVWDDYCHQPSLCIFSSAEFTNRTNNAVKLWSFGVQGSVQF